MSAEVLTPARKDETRRRVLEGKSAQGESREELPRYGSSFFFQPDNVTLHRKCEGWTDPGARPTGRASIISSRDAGIAFEPEGRPLEHANR